MIVSKAYEFRLYPTNEQKLQIGKTIGSARYVYNCFLAKRKELYAAEKLSLNYNQCSAILTTMKGLWSTKQVGTVGPTLRSTRSFHHPSFVASVVRRTEC